MHINSHFTPANVGASSRPDHAANPSGRGPQFEVADAEAATTAAAAEEITEPNIPDKSVAHQARAELATLTVLDGHNFGWLVSQIAQGTSDAAAYATPEEDSEGDGADSTAANTEAAGDGEVASTETAAASGENTTSSSDETTSESTDPVADPVADPGAELVGDLVDDLLENDEDGSEVT